MRKRALISVADKENIETFARGLNDLDYEIVSTGGTLRTLQEAGIPAVPVEDVTGFPEILDGRVKTLHPAIHGGLLADWSNEDHKQQLQERNIEAIDLVAVNLYPFQATLEKEDATDADVIEHIDIGGPSMLRAAAKNAASRLVVVDPRDYTSVLDMLRVDAVTPEKREEMAAKVFRHTAHYDVLIADYLTKKTNNVFPETYSVTFEKAQDLRYGENPHQEAAFYRESFQHAAGIANAEQLHGKELSYNNIQDANAAVEIAGEFEQPVAVAVKHMNPCGVGVSDSISGAFTKAYQSDPTSIFGGIVALNREVDTEAAEQMASVFLEIIIAPSFTDAAFQTLREKKNIRLLTLSVTSPDASDMKLASVQGGLLVQQNDAKNAHDAKVSVPTKRAPSDAERADLEFAQNVVKHVKSNTIVLVKNQQTIGIGAGQMNRVGAAEIAIKHAGLEAEGAVAASDAFFPMPDTVEVCARAGVTAIIQPGGSKKDHESIESCDHHGIAMVHTGVRHFKH